MKFTAKTLGKYKLSEILDKVIEDVKKTQECGITLDMNRWAEPGEGGKVCTACLGGAAVLGFTSNICEVKPEYGSLYDLTKVATSSDQGQQNLRSLAIALDNLRCGSFTGFFSTMSRINEEFCPEESGAIITSTLKRLGKRKAYRFSGIVKGKDLETLLNFLSTFSVVLKEYSY